MGYTVDMADIQFEEEQQYQQQAAEQMVNQKPFFIRLVLSTKIVSTDTQAEYVLLGVAIFFVILAIAIPLFSGSGSGGKPPPPMAPLPAARSL